MAADATLKPMQSSWALYQQVRLEPDMPADELREFRRAYYGGAAAMLTLLQHIADMSDADRVSTMTALQAEIDIHLATVGSTLEGLV